MPAIKQVSTIAEKWARVTPQRSQDYELGVKAPRRDWKQATAAAAERYAQGVQAAVQNKLFGKGVEKAGTEKWQRKAIEVGPRRFSEGVQVAAPDYEKGFAPYREVIEKTVLPARFAKGDPRNIDRVRAMAMALAEAKRK